MDLIGSKCLLCGDIVYQRTSWDKEPTCRCGNVFLDSGARFRCVIPGKIKEVHVSLGENLDKNILEMDEAYGYRDYGVIHSDVDEEKINRYRAEVLLIKNGLQ